MAIQLSKSNELIWSDIKRWIKNIIVFSAGSLIVALTVLQQGGTFQEAGLALYGALINALIDLFSKYKGETKYVNGTVVKVTNPIGN